VPGTAGKRGRRAAIAGKAGPGNGGPRGACRAIAFAVPAWTEKTRVVVEMNRNAFPVSRFPRFPLFLVAAVLAGPRLRFPGTVLSACQLAMQWPVARVPRTALGSVYVAKYILCLFVLTCVLLFARVGP